jgi:hypothetical protein
MAGKKLNVLLLILLCGIAVSTLTAFHGGSRPESSKSDFDPASSSTGGAASYYLDCSASQNGKGSKSSPWNSLAAINAITAHAGDHLYLRRSTTCNGTLSPQGSGAAEASIVIDAYGSGASPVIDGGSAEEAVKLFNQQYWEINNLEISGGNLYGIYVSGNVPNSTLHHIYLRNLNVHSAGFTSIKRGDSGEVFLSPKGSSETFDDILIDGVTAHDSHAAEGIIVSAGGAWIETNGVSQPLGSHVIVQNSTVHDVYGDGIMIAEVTNGMLQRNVVYRSGLCKKCTGSTPVGLWEWYCHTCTVQYNESYANQSWAGDGGDFDIDYFNEDNIVQYNYGHDSDGYCVAVFGAGGRATIHSIFRYNVCSNNGRRADISNQGEVFVHTWDNGTLDGVEIYNNTFYWNPASNAAAFSANDAAYSGSRPRFFKNNIIYATVPDMIDVTSSFVLDNNIYWTTSAPPNWKFDKTTYNSLNTFQSATTQDIHSYFIDPRLKNPSYHAVGRPGNDFRLLSGSQAIRSGANVCTGINNCSIGTEDFCGRRFSSSHVQGIGACENP